MSFTVNLANTRGMCSGVDRAIRVVNIILEKHKNEKVYVYHEVVHNKHVVSDLAKKGAIFVEHLSDIPNNSVVIFSAHGVGLSTIEKAKSKNLTVIDATCPLVKRIHRKMNQAAQLGQEAIVIGHKGHQEVIGTVGQYDGDKSLVHVVLTEDDVKNLEVKTDNLTFATQTTLSVDETVKTVTALKKRFPNIDGPKTDDTCFATQLRQNAIKELSAVSDIIIVAGSANSSNSNRLREVAESCGIKAYLVDDASNIELAWLENVKSVGVSAGASVPEYVVEEILAFLKENGATDINLVGKEDPARAFPLPEGC